MQGNFLTEIRKLAEEVSSREGCYLYDIEMVGAGNGRVLRVTIDKDASSMANAVPSEHAPDPSSDVSADGAGADANLDSDVALDIESSVSSSGVSVEDCTNVSRAMNLRLDVEDIIPGGQYQLEVSSPGLERVLKEPRHYQGALNKQISVKSFAPLAQFNSELPIELSKAKQIQGPLLSYDDKGIRVGYTPAVKKGADALPAIEIFVPYESVTKSHVVYEFEAPQKPGQKPGKPGKTGGKQK